MVMSGESIRSNPSISIEAAHAADRAKDITYPPRPLREAPDYDVLRARVLEQTREARASLGDDEA